MPRLKYSGECSGGKCQRPKWQKWSDWSECSTYSLIKSRWRECLRGGVEFADGECEGSEFEMDVCENESMGRSFEFVAIGFIFIQDNIFKRFINYIFLKN